MHLISFKPLLLFSMLFALALPVQAKYPKHSFMPFLGVASTGISDFSLRVSHDLQVSYSSGDRFRTPLGLRYQYRMKKGHILGLDLISIYNPLVIKPQYLDANSQFGGPSMASGTQMLGGNIHYSKTIDIKLIEIFGMAGLGAYYQNTKTHNTDFLWYQNAPANFYEFAPLVHNSALKNWMPVVVFGAGIRFRHLEFGLHNQVSISGPVNAFTYKGYSHQIPLNWSSIGYYVGYRFEF